MKIIIQANENGTIEGINLDRIPSIKKLGAVTSKRASNVLPLSYPKRIAFIVFRKCFGDKGRIAEWTRKWRGKWFIDFGPTIGGTSLPFETRKEALEYEHNWLTKNIYF